MSMDLSSEFEGEADGHKVDPRHQRRVDLMQQLFAYSFSEQSPFNDAAAADESSFEEIKEIIAVLPEIDQAIQAVAPERPLKDINKVDLAILRLIVFEARTAKTPIKVLINEAVELAKEYGSEESFKFVNGALGTLIGEKNSSKAA